MNAIVVDTNVLVYMLKDSEEFKDFEEYLKDKRIVLCFATVAEIELWISIEEGTNGEKLNKMRQRWFEFLSKCDVYHSSVNLIDRAVKLALHLNQLKQSQGSHRKHWPDIWIAATALELEIPVLTNDYEDFKKFIKYGLQISPDPQAI